MFGDKAEVAAAVTVVAEAEDTELAVAVEDDIAADEGEDETEAEEELDPPTVKSTHDS